MSCFVSARRRAIARYVGRGVRPVGHPRTRRVSVMRACSIRSRRRWASSSPMASAELKTRNGVLGIRSLCEGIEKETCCYNHPIPTDERRANNSGSLTKFGADVLTVAGSYRIEQQIPGRSDTSADYDSIRREQRRQRREAES